MTQKSCHELRERYRALISTRYPQKSKGVLSPKGADAQDRLAIFDPQRNQIAALF